MTNSRIETEPDITDYAPFLDMRGLVYIDESGAFGGDLLALSDNWDGSTNTYPGDLFLIDGQGNYAKIATLPGIWDSGSAITPIPNDPAWGPLAGTILFAPEGGNGTTLGGSASDFTTVYDISLPQPDPLSGSDLPQVTVTPYELSGTPAIAPEWMSMVPSNSNLYLTDGESDFYAAPAIALSFMAGNVLVVGEYGDLARLYWDGAHIQSQIVTYHVPNDDANSDLFEAGAFGPEGPETSSTELGHEGPSSTLVPLAGRTVYLDLNNNGTWDAGEPTTTTAADGSYTFDNLGAGTYHVGEVLPTGWKQATPLQPTYTITLAADEQISGIDFGSKLGTPTLSPPVFTSQPPTTAATGGQTFRYAFTATDVNPGLTITYDLPEHPDGMTIDNSDPSHPAIVWDVPEVPTEACRVLLRAKVTDASGKDFVAIQPFTLNVLGAVAMSTGLVDLNWTSVEGAQYYEVYRDTSANFSATWDNMIADDLTTSSFEDDWQVSAGTTFYYQIYAVTGPDSYTFLGQTSATTPVTDMPLYGPSTPSGDLQGTLCNVAPTNVHAQGVNDREILVSWDHKSVMNPDGYEIEVLSGGQWDLVGEAPAAATTFIVRGCGPGGANFLQVDQPYTVRVRAINTCLTSFEDSHSAWGYPDGAAYVRPERFDNIIVVVGGYRQHMEYLLKGNGLLDNKDHSLYGNSVGQIWLDLVNAGYNAFLTADPWDGGDGKDGAADLTAPILLGNGSGRIYDEMMVDIALNTLAGDWNTPIGLIGYSHGGGMISNISNRLWNDPFATTASVIVAATIDGIEYGTYTDPSFADWNPLGDSPAITPDWGGLGVNYYTLKGPWAWKKLHGVAMPGAANMPRLNDDHSSIGIDPEVLSGVEYWTGTAFAGFYSYVVAYSHNDGFVTPISLDTKKTAVLCPELRAVLH
ncbi:MAG: hypothetical protein ABR964_16360 [Tepidisphaeraceae bacterium]